MAKIIRKKKRLRGRARKRGVEGDDGETAEGGGRGGSGGGESGGEKEAKVGKRNQEIGSFHQLSRKLRLLA